MNTYHINPSSKVVLRIAIVTITGVLALQLIGCAKSNPTSTNPTNTPSGDSTTVTSLLIDPSAAPNTSSNAIEPIWDKATVLSLLATATSGSSATVPVTIRSVNDGSNVYFLVQYDEAQPSYMHYPLRFLGGNFLDTANWVIDSSQVGDAFSFMFEMTPATVGSQTFAASGCAMLCHTTTTAKWQPGMFAENSGTLDTWIWRAGSSTMTGLAEDDLSTPFAGIDFDEASDQLIGNNTLDYFNRDVTKPAGHLPTVIAGGNNGGFDAHYFLWSTTASYFDTSSTNPVTGKSWAKDDLVPGEYSGPHSGTSDQWDVEAVGFWSAGKWTIKFKRAFTTESKYKDVQFIPGGRYPFSFSIHANQPITKHYGILNRALILAL